MESILHKIDKDWEVKIIGYLLKTISSFDSKIGIAR